MLFCEGFVGCGGYDDEFWAVGFVVWCVRLVESYVVHVCEVFEEFCCYCFFLEWCGVL